MDDKNTIPSEDQNLACFLFLAELKYMLAGDPQCSEPLDLLFQRLRAIRWDDPAFIAMSEEMRSGTPRLTPEQATSLKPSLLGLIYMQGEQIAAACESANLLSGLIPRLKKMTGEQAQMKELLLKQIAQSERLVDFASKMIDLHSRMRDRLQMLGADTSEFEAPNFEA